MSFEPEDRIGASELRQWLYCPRVVWYGRQFGDHRPTSAMMRVGIDEEAERRRLESRRTFAGYGIEAVARHHQVRVWSERLALSGLVDTLLQLSRVSLEEAVANRQDPKEQIFVPVEFKTTTRADQRENLVQLVAYALCLEEMTRTPVRFGFLVLLPDEEVFRQTIGHPIRRTVEQIASDARTGLAGTELPEPTPHRGKCRQCEFRRFCNDVW